MVTYAADIVRKEEEGYISKAPSVASHEDSDDGVEDEEYEDEDDNDAIRMRCCQSMATRYAGTQVMRTRMMESRTRSMRTRTITMRSGCDAASMATRYADGGRAAAQPLADPLAPPPLAAVRRGGQAPAAAAGPGGGGHQQDGKVVSDA